MSPVHGLSEWPDMQQVFRKLMFFDEMLETLSLAGLQ